VVSGSWREDERLTHPVTERPLYERDPEAWRAYLAEGNRTQARKRVGADVLFRDEVGRVLVVDPRYKPDWDLPGGMAEANEPPLDAAMREIREELGIEWPGGRLLVVDWVAPHGPWDDSLMFVFDGGVLDGVQRAAITLRDNELREHRFAPAEEAGGLLRPYVWRRVQSAMGALEMATARYLHDGWAR
jgi:8-oxo-dGTP pyrophosphatase MutT (NUDIX family)